MCARTASHPIESKPKLCRHHKFIANACRNSAQIMKLMQRYVVLNPWSKDIIWRVMVVCICALIETETYSWCGTNADGMNITKKYVLQ